MVDGPVSSRRFSRRQIRSALIIGGSVIAVLIVVIGGWQFYSSSSESALEETQKQLEQATAQLAEQVALPFAELDDQLDLLSQDPVVIALFVEADEEKLVEASTQRLATFSSGLKLRFILPGKYELDKDSIPPLSYGSLDLLRQAETSTGVIKTEVHFFGSPNEHIVMIKRVSNESGEIVGILHLSLDVGLFNEIIAGLDMNNSFLELSQGSGNKVVTLGKHGDAAMQAGEPSKMSIKGTRWTISLWTDTGAIRSDAGSGSGFGTIGLLLGLILIIAAGLGVFFLKRSGSTSGPRKKSSEIVYAGAVRAIMDGAHPGMEKMVPNLPSSDNKSDAESLI